MNRTCKICWIILAVFLVGNLIVFAFWYRSMGNEMRPPFFRNQDKEQIKQQARQRFMDRIGLDSIQFEEFARMRMEHMKMVNRYNKEIDSLKQVLMNQTFTGTADMKVVNQSIDGIADLQKKIELLNFDHYKAMRAKCTNNEQRMKLDETFRGWMERPHGRHGRGRGPR